MMKSCAFTTSAHGKCLLAGEHAVLSGCPALILPVQKKKLDLIFIPDEIIEIDNDMRELQNSEAYGANILVQNELDANLTYSNRVGEFASHSFWTKRLDSISLPVLQLPHIFKYFRKSLKQALISLNRVFPEDIQGSFNLTNNIEIGAGLGFSAALCVVISRWLVWKNWINEKLVFDFARDLENYYHGQSSGVDIVGVMSDQMIHFELAKNSYEIKAAWHPKLYVSYSGQKKTTKAAIKQVQKLKEQNPVKAVRIEANMIRSVWEIEKSLNQDERTGMVLLINGIKRAKSCFEDWGLISPKLEEHLNLLSQLGALAVKPTGAGLGGYVISLWEYEPQNYEKIEWIAL